MARSEMGVVGRAAVGAAAPGARFSGALVLALSTVLLTTGLAVAAPPEAGQAAAAGEDDFGLVNINKADPVARRDLKGIGLALMIFESANRRFPAAAICDGKGKPLLSWRVAILPYLKQANLYGQFRLDEPWDSEHNLKLLEKMPAVYASDGTRPGSGMTRYLVPTGPGTLFPDPATSLGMAAVSDGLSRTILAVEAEADRAVPWTKPDDLPIDFAEPLAGLRKSRDDGFLACFGDGHVELIAADTAPNHVAAGFTIKGIHDHDLQAIKKLTPEKAALLVAECGGIGERGVPLTVESLETLDTPEGIEIARILAKTKGELHLPGIKRLSPDAAGVLAGFKGAILSLEGLTTLSADVAKALAACEQWNGHLPKITALDSPDSVAIARIFASGPAPLSLPNLKKVSPKTLAALIDKEDAAIPPIDTLELIAEPDGGPTEGFVIPERLQKKP